MSDPLTYEAEVKAFVRAEAQRRLAAGEPLDGLVTLQWVQRRQPNGTVEETGPYLVPTKALTMEEKHAADPFGRYYTLWQLTQGEFKV